MQLLEPDELEAWRLTISPGWRADVFRDIRRMLNAWQRWGWIQREPDRRDPQQPPPRPRGRPAHLAERLGDLRVRSTAGFEHVPIARRRHRLRPEEWLALERRDLDLEGRVLHVRRVFSGGVLTELGADGAKTFRQRRRVPLAPGRRRRARSAMPRTDRHQAARAALAPRTIRPPDPVGVPGPLLAGSVRRRRAPLPEALRACGTPTRPSQIAAGVGLFELSRFMGTSLEQIDRTYGHLVDDAEDRNLEVMDAYDQNLVDASSGSGGRGR